MLKGMPIPALSTSLPKGLTIFTGSAPKPPVAKRSNRSKSFDLLPYRLYSLLLIAEAVPKPAFLADTGDYVDDELSQILDNLSFRTGARGLRRAINVIDWRLDANTAEALTIMEERRGLQARRERFVEMLTAASSDSEEEQESYVRTGQPDDLFDRPVASRKRSRSELSTSPPPSPLFHPTRLLPPPPHGSASSSSIVRVASGSGSSSREPSASGKRAKKTYGSSQK